MAPPILIAERPSSLLAPRPMQDATRREFISGVGAAALAAAFLAACGDDEVAGETPTVESNFPVTIDHHRGSTTIPRMPERVVVFGYNEQDALLALGVKPLAVRDWQGFAVGPWAEDALGESDLVVMETADLEQVAAFAPDLIVAVYYRLDETEYGLLTQIAPTLVRRDDFDDYNLPWDAQFALIGEALGMSETAEDVISDLREQFEAVREAHPAWEGRTFAFVSPRDGGIYRVRAANEQRARFFRDLGFTVPSEHNALAGDNFIFDLGPEQARSLDVDLLVWSSDPSEVANDPLLQQLEVVRDGRVLFLEELLGSALAFNSPLSLSYALDRLVPQLEQVTDALE